MKAQNLVIVNEAPSCFDQKLVGMMMSISFERTYNSIFTKRKSPGGFFLFDIGKIISVESSISEENGTIKVDYGENGGICNVNLWLSDYASDTITISKNALNGDFLSNCLSDTAKSPICLYGRVDEQTNNNN